MSENPDQIRQDIERTRGALSSTVDALADKVSPSNIAHRQADKLRGVAGSVREHVMGAVEDVGDAASAVPQVASAVGAAASDATGSVRRRAQGNPLAAGLVAFGLGWLASSLVPATEREQELARSVKDKAAPLVAAVTDAASQAVQDLQEPVQEALGSVKATATESFGTVKDEGLDAAQGLTQDAKDAADRVGPA